MGLGGVITIWGFLLEEAPWPSLEQDFSDFHMHSNHRRVLENADSDIAGLEWGLRLCTANKLLGDADVVGPETRLNIKELEAPKGLIHIKH